MKFSYLFLLCISTTLQHFQSAEAKSLGTYGHTFEIIEPDLLKQIVSRLTSLENDGSLAKHQEKLTQNAKRSVANPKPVQGITKAIEDRTFFYDPSFATPFDLKDHKGKVFHKAGTRINSLEHRSLTSVLLFLDGNDLAQIAWAESVQTKQSSKVILTSGSPFELMKKWDRPVYFDQEGTLTKKLRIKHVPAIVVQEGLKLKISEIDLTEEKK